MIITGERHIGGIHSKPIPWDVAMNILAMLMDDPERDWRRLFAYAFGLFTGARASEVAGVTWSDIYGINETARGRKDLRFVLQAKKGNGKRIIEMAPELIDAIIRVKEFAGPEVQKGARPVILSSRTRKAYASNVDASQLVNSALVMGGVFDTRGVHTLRKTMARRMYEIEGCTNEALHFVQMFLGHTSQVSTMHYIGVTGEKVKEIIHSLNREGFEVGPGSFYKGLEWRGDSLRSQNDSSEERGKSHPHLPGSRWDTSEEE